MFVGDVGMGVNPPAGYTTDVIIAAFPWGAYLGAEALERDRRDGFFWNRVAPNTILQRPKRAVTICLRCWWVVKRVVMAIRKALPDVNGYISEGAGENLFEVKDGILFTPPFTSSALPGITRDAIIKLAKDLDIEVREQVLSRESLYRRRSVHVRYRGRNHPSTQRRWYPVGEGRCGPVTKRIQQAFFGLFTGETEDKYGWLDQVNQ